MSQVLKMAFPEKVCPLRFIQKHSKITAQKEKVPTDAKEPIYMNMTFKRDDVSIPVLNHQVNLPNSQKDIHREHMKKQKLFQ